MSENLLTKRRSMKILTCSLALVLACADATSPAPDTGMQRLDNAMASVSRDYAAGSAACEFGVGAMNHHRSLACWSSFLAALGATATQAGVCTAAAAALPTRNAEAITRSMGACVTALGISVAAWNTWAEGMDRDGHRDWSDHEIQRRQDEARDERMGR